MIGWLRKWYTDGHGYDLCESVAIRLIRVPFPLSFDNRKSAFGNFGTWYTMSLPGRKSFCRLLSDCPLPILFADLSLHERYRQPVPVVLPRFIEDEHPALDTIQGLKEFVDLLVCRPVVVSLQRFVPPTIAHTRQTMNPRLP